MTMTTKLVVLIAAHGQPRPLRRTLQSLADCHKPAGYAGVVVVENGPLAGLEAVVLAFPANLQFQYLYSPPPNKSIALNHALSQLTGAVVFTDDDVQVPCETLAAYSRALGACRGGAFYGGPIAAEYEGERPPAWLLPLLPRSAAGWQLATPEKLVIEKPEFIGPNFAAFADDLLRVGGFDCAIGSRRAHDQPRGRHGDSRAAAGGWRSRLLRVRRWDAALCSLRRRNGRVRGSTGPAERNLLGHQPGSAAGVLSARVAEGLRPMAERSLENRTLAADRR